VGIFLFVIVKTSLPIISGSDSSINLRTEYALSRVTTK